MLETRLKEKKKKKPVWAVGIQKLARLLLLILCIW